MHLVTLIANRALTGNYGHREAGESFTTDNRTAELLEARGLARRHFPLASIKMTAPPENKMLTAEENKADYAAERIEITMPFDEGGRRRFMMAPYPEARPWPAVGRKEQAERVT